MQTLTHLDLFSGIGGFALAAHRAGFETVGFCEKEPYAQKVLIKNFGAILADRNNSRNWPFGGNDKSNAKESYEWRDNQGRSGSDDSGKPRPATNEPPIHPDIFTLNGGDYAGVTLITGGFPCQPFSHAGKRRGAEDDRHLWPEMFRVVKEARPAFVLGENVFGLIHLELDNCISDLESIGYAVRPLVIPACAVDARHRRDRVWLLCSDTRHNYCTKQECQHERAEVGNGSGANGLDARKDVADAASLNAGARRPGRSEARPETANGGSDVVNANGSGQQHAGKSQPGERLSGEGQPTNRTAAGAMRWDAEPGMGRVADGVPHRVDRLRGLGNAIVPQVAEVILREIANLIRCHA